jgi:uncharacterized membrane protein
MTWLSGRRVYDMATLVTGVFKTRSSAERATEDLVHYGFSRDDISLLMSDATKGREFALQMATKAPEGAATGATIGGVIGAVAAGLVALGIIVVPGLGLVAAGPIVATLAGLGAGAAAGGVTGALIGLGIPEHEARFYHEEIEKGGILLGVYTHDDRAQQARKILDAAGAEKVK